MIKSDKWIRGQAGMIEPFEPQQIRETFAGKRVISYGTSSYGYDVRLAPEFKRVGPITNKQDDPWGRPQRCIDPKNSGPLAHFFSKEPFTIWPNEFVLGRTVERIKVPRDVLVLCVGKSTYARCGLIVNVTPLEPEWEGYVTLEISNTGMHPCLVYPNEGIAQFVFLGGDQAPETSYADRGGKYMNTVGVVGAKV